MNKESGKYGINRKLSVGENRIKILFVCHGNICRSTMAEYVMKDLVSKSGLAEQFYIDSAATSREEIGNPVHPGTRKKLQQENIPCGNHRARQLQKEEYNQYDYLIGMDNWNIRNIMRIIKEDPQKKVYKLLEFANKEEEIADPWYTGNFDKTYEDVRKGCEGLLAEILKTK
ncbi:MAG: low molecular weight phosphotyrosine protein phosphatase [Candidatus Ruminococcus intestinipullorum]|nr:low molecular weight phosphotyrosine protein phosphatase [Candidatus Ruminococcus intestinipullorum]